MQANVRIFHSTDGEIFDPAELVTLEEVPRPKTNRDPRAFNTSKIVVQRAGDKLYLHADDGDGKFFRRDGTKWTKIFDDRKDYPINTSQALHFFGEEGYIRIVEGPTQWRAFASTKPSADADQASVEYASVPQVTATRFKLNLANPALLTHGAGTTFSLVHKAQLKTTTIPARTP
jgi:hypothetical protein